MRQGMDDCVRGSGFPDWKCLYKSKNLHERALFCHGAMFGNREAEEFGNREAEKFGEWLRKRLRDREAERLGNGKWKKPPKGEVRVPQIPCNANLPWRGLSGGYRPGQELLDGRRPWQGLSWRVSASVGAFGRASAPTRASPMGAGPGGRMKARADVCGEGGRPDAEGFA